MFPHLIRSNARINLGLLQEAACNDLLEILDHREGTKAIVWDESLFGPIGLIAKYTWLKERNVDKIFNLQMVEKLPDMNVKHIIFITRPALAVMDAIAKLVHADDRRAKGSAASAGGRGAAAGRGGGPSVTGTKEYHLYFVPRVSQLCEKHLQDRGVFGSFATIGAFACEIYPVDSDLLSMELPNVYKELHIEGDPTCLYTAATALSSLQRLYGRIPKVYGKGEYAHQVWNLTKKIARDDALPNAVQVDKTGFDQLIILDRSIDLMSVLATQLTYEGLIDECFGINQSTVNFPAATFESDDKPLDKSTASSSSLDSDQKIRIILNSADNLFAGMRDKHINACGQILSREAKSIAALLSTNQSEKSVQEIRMFVNTLPALMAQKKSLATHTTIAHLIKEHTGNDAFLNELSCEQDFLMCDNVDRVSPIIEDLLVNGATLRTVLRLICMQCLAGSGFKPKVLDYYKRELVHVYGIEVLLTVSQLEKAGLLRLQTGARSYAVLRKTLKLTVEDAAEVAPKDISYVHTSYAPLTIRIVEQSIKLLGWATLHDVLSSLPGPTFEDNQSTLGGYHFDAVDGPTTRRSSLTSEMSQSEQRRVILVFFLGGCTFAEVSALRFLAQEDGNVEFVIATTKLVNKNSFLDDFIEQPMSVRRNK